MEFKFNFGVKVWKNDLLQQHDHLIFYQVQEPAVEVALEVF